MFLAAVACFISCLPASISCFALCIAGPTAETQTSRLPRPCLSCLFVMLSSAANVCFWSSCIESLTAVALLWSVLLPDLLRPSNAAVIFAGASSQRRIHGLDIRNVVHRNSRMKVQRGRRELKDEGAAGQASQFSKDTGNVYSWSSPNIVDSNDGSEPS